MRAFGAIAIEIFAIVIQVVNGIVKMLFRFLYLLANFWQIGNFQRRTVFFYERVQVNPMKMETIILQSEAILRKIKGLVHQVKIGIFH